MHIPNVGAFAEGTGQTGRRRTAPDVRRRLRRTLLMVLVMLVPSQSEAHDASDQTDRPTAAPSHVIEFVRAYQGAWAARDPAALEALWHPDGNLFDPLYDRVLNGREIPALTRGQLQRNPDLKWTLVDWTTRKNVVVMEWQTELTIAGHPFEWRGVDKAWIR